MQGCVLFSTYAEENSFNFNILLLEYKVHVAYISNWVLGPYCNVQDRDFFPSGYGPGAKRVGHESRGKSRACNLQYWNRKRGWEDSYYIST